MEDAARAELAERSWQPCWRARTAGQCCEGAEGLRQAKGGLGRWSAVKGAGVKAGGYAILPYRLQ